MKGRIKVGKIVAVNISDRKGIIKHTIEKGFFKAGYGLEGDAHGGSWHRQVSLLAVESIEKMKALGIKELQPGSFAENLTTEGIVLYELKVGTKFKIGEVVLELTQIGKECHKGCEIRTIVGECVMPREGIFTRVLSEGWIRAGDTIEIVC